jgi:VCBS repeat protein
MDAERFIDTLHRDLAVAGQQATPGRGRHLIRSLVVLCLLARVLPSTDLPRWQETTVTSLKMGYQLVVADLNRDGRPDLIVVDERGTELA